MSEKGKRKNENHVGCGLFCAWFGFCFMSAGGITFFGVLTGLLSEDTPEILHIIICLFFMIMGIVIFLFGLFLFAFPIMDILDSIKWFNYLPLIKKANEYIEYNKTSLGRFARPGGLKATKIVLANKYVVLEFNVKKLKDGVWTIVITDKINMEITTVKFWLNKKVVWFEVFRDMCSIVRYKTDVGNFVRYFARRGVKFEREIKKTDELLLDINQASEAELTALPGVTIAKAKHAVKVRNKQKLFLTMNQFYETINLDEEFIEQIQTRGNKIILSELPEYKKLQLEREE